MGVSVLANSEMRFLCPVVNIIYPPSACFNVEPEEAIENLNVELRKLGF
jgi:hypothetical protein